MSEHTPAPWQSGPEEWTEGKTRIITGNMNEVPALRRIVCYVGDENDFDETDEANAW